MTVDDLNHLAPQAFTHALAEIFEHSPWVAERAAASRPFSSVEALHEAMVAVVSNATSSEKLSLLCAHPELAGRETLTASSAAEQGSKGLDRLTGAQAAALAARNAAYRARFGFPFIIAVRGQRDIAMILDAMDRRLPADREKEVDVALTEVAKIARFRLDTVLDGKK